MKKSFLNITLIVLLVIQGHSIFPQIKKITFEGIKSEGNFYNKNDQIYSDAIVINFNKNVIPLSNGIQITNKNKIDRQFIEIKQLIAKLENAYGDVIIEKQIPDAEWGDIYRRHKATGQQVKLHDFSQLFTLRFSTPVPLDSVINLFNALDIVDYVHGPVLYEYHDSPNDEYFQQNLLWHLSAVDAVRAWDITHGTNSPKIGIVDDGIMSTHNDLLGKIAGGTGYFVNTSDHGTLVAGVLAANTNNTEGVASLGWNLSIYNYGGPNTVSTTSLVAQRIVSATNADMDIINMSFGTLRKVDPETVTPACSLKGWLDAVIPHDYTEIRNAVSNAVALGIICIASAGNRSKNDGRPGQSECDQMPIPFANYPSQYPGVIAVSATGKPISTEQFVSYYNYGNFVDISAPGLNIYSTYVDGGYASKSGTSFSAPLTSALAGLILSINSSITSTQMENILKNTTDKIPAPANHPYDSNGWSEALGYGRINAYKALKYTLENYGGTLAQSFTIPAGETWTFQPGKTVKFASGVTLTVNGTLNATSTTFTSSTTSNYWGGIVYNSGSSGDLNGCAINRVQTGAGGAAVTINNNATVAVRFCSITNNNTGTTNGINIIGSGNRNIYQNAINTFSNHGVYVYQGNAQLRYNNISGAQTGKAAVYCDYYATPLLGGTSNPFEGRNTLQNSFMGLYANNNCNINAGASGFANNNRFVNNTSANIYAANNTTVAAQYAWWGSYPPNYKITAILNSTVNSGNPLQTDPGAMFKPVKGEGFDNTLANQLYKPGVSEENTPIADNYKSLIPNLWAQYRSSKDAGIISQLNSILERKSDPDMVRPLALEVLSFIYASDNKIKEAVLLNEKLISEYKGLVHEKNGLMNLFFIYYDAQDYKNAEAALSRIDKAYSSNEEVMLANWLLNKDRVDITKPHESLVSETTLPEEYGLSTNYPNPFNPSTTINYNLPNDGFVSLKVYDILGNEVADLINDVRSAGSYNVEFNASNLASGVYIYRIQVKSTEGGFMASRKMLLAK